MDNLNTHQPGALYVSEARRIAQRLEFVAHGSWLNPGVRMAEIEFVARMGDRRIVARIERSGVRGADGAPTFYPAD